ADREMNNAPRPAPIAVRARRAWSRLQGQHVPRLAALSITLFALGSVAIYFAEMTSDERNIRSFGDAMWYSIVTMSTVGYGDLSPKTTLGKFIGVALMLSGMSLLFLFTATIASYLVTQRIREERGLDTIRWTDHILVCGWNQYGESVLEGLLQASGRSALIVLVNDGPEETAHELMYRNHDATIHYIHGDPAAEATLERANVRHARAAIVLTDTSRASAAADEHTTLVTLAVKSLKPDIKVTAEALETSSEAHLRRAGADDIVISGEFNGFMLSSAALSPGMSRVVRRLLSFGEGELSHLPIPREYVGRTFADVFRLLREDSGFLTLAIVAESKAVTLDDLLTDDYSLVDEFIRQQFSEAGTEYLRFEEGEMRVLVNPPDSYVIQPDDAAIGIPRLA